MVYPENIDSGHSNFKLDNRSGCHHCNLAHLQLHALNRLPLPPSFSISFHEIASWGDFKGLHFVVYIASRLSEALCPEGAESLTLQQPG